MFKFWFGLVVGIIIIVIIIIIIRARRRDIDRLIKNVQESHKKCLGALTQAESEILSNKTLTDKTAKNVLKQKKYLDRATQNLLIGLKLTNKNLPNNNLFVDSVMLSLRCSDLLSTRAGEGRHNILKLSVLLGGVINNSASSTELICSMAKDLAAEIYGEVALNYKDYKNEVDQMCAIDPSEDKDLHELKKMYPTLYSVGILIIQIGQSYICTNKKFDLEKFGQFLNAFVYTACNNSDVLLKQLKNMVLVFYDNLDANTANKKMHEAGINFKLAVENTSKKRAQREDERKAQMAEFDRRNNRERELDERENDLNLRESQLRDQEQKLISAGTKNI